MVVEKVTFHPLKLDIRTMLKKNLIVLECDNCQLELNAFSAMLHVEKILENSNPKNINFRHQLYNSKQFMNSLTSNKSIEVH